MLILDDLITVIYHRTCDAVDDVCFERRAPWAWYPGECLCLANSAVELKSMGVVYFPTRSCPSSSTLLFKLGTQTSLRYISRLLAKCEQTMLISIAVRVTHTGVFHLKYQVGILTLSFVKSKAGYCEWSSWSSESGGGFSFNHIFVLENDCCHVHLLDI